MSQLRKGNSRRVSSIFKTASSIAPSDSADRTETLHRARVLEQWTTARLALRGAIQDYIIACEAIEADCKRESTSFLDECALEENFVAINAELASLTTDEQRLWKARAALRGLRNMSSMLSPVNLLPSLVLTSIFLKAVEADRTSRAVLARRVAIEQGDNPAIQARLKRPDTATVISSVNTHWRKIALRTQELWSHIDLGESGARTDIPFAKAKLWLERSQGTPLYLTINTTGPAATIIDAWGILPLLRSHEAHYRSLSLTLNTIDEVHAVLAGWINEGAPNSLTSLTISIPWATKPGDSPHALPPGLLTHERDAFFEPLRTLDLDGTYLSWTGPAFRNLVDLRLSRIKDRACPTIEQLVAILNESPALCTLWLRRMDLRIEGRLNFPPVKMESLQILGLEYVEPQGICLLLPLLAPEPELYVIFEGYARDPGGVGEALTDLFARSKVEKLHFSIFINPVQLPRMLVRLQHLRTFTWQGVDIGDEFFEAMAHNPIITDGHSNVEGNGNADTASSNLCPHLHTLDLQGCSISATALRDLVTNRVIPKLTIAECHISVDGTGEDAPRLMEELEKCLNDSVSDLLLLENSLIVD
ncbi:unnamed protein product [Rhizoctonia solani]|uniref:F-box domain-containing protein n=1 Tax=Rhizoctonia solani TaxID=456999 RepID=A0A8H3BWI7_9AGAM|nr:unnamed protein product [Rhizoctonia solani]